MTEIGIDHGLLSNLEELNRVLKADIKSRILPIIKEKDKSYAISSIKSDDKFGFSMYSNMVEVIVNSSPSIILKNGGIIIRGESSLYGSNSALIILDGKEIDIAELYTLPPMDVKSVDILKGGSAAIYGSRGANGVIIINTKRGAD